MKIIENIVKISILIWILVVTFATEIVIVDLIPKVVGKSILLIPEPLILVITFIIFKLSYFVLLIFFIYKDINLKWK